MRAQAATKLIVLLNLIQSGGRPLKQVTQSPHPTPDTPRKARSTPHASHPDSALASRCGRSPHLQATGTCRCDRCRCGMNCPSASPVFLSALPARRLAAGAWLLARQSSGQCWRCGLCTLEQLSCHCKLQHARQSLVLFQQANF